MKKYFLILLAIACLLTLAGCGCKHENWVDAKHRPQNLC